MKKCFKCNEEKDLSLFYVHKGMKDGRLNKCIDCTKKDTENRTKIEKQKEGYAEKERKRGRDKYHRLYVGTGKANKERSFRYHKKYPEKVKCKIMSNNLLKPFDGAEKHHWSYNVEHAKDVIWLTKKEHMKAHRFIVYDQERFMYRRFDNNILLDTKEEHEKFIKDCILNQEN